MDWLRTVPSRWEVGRLKRICRFAYGDSLSEEIRRKGNVPVFGSNGPVGFHASANTNAPCIVVGRKGSFGKVNYSCTPVFAIDTTFFIDTRYSSADIRWLYYLLGWLRLDDISRDSAVPGLNREESYRRLIPIPPRAEQTAIARFLDHAVHRIQRYVDAKQKLIALLVEQKRATISQVVTGQIDVRTGEPYADYQPSRIGAPVEVPAHWDVRRLKYLATVNPGWSKDGHRPAPDDRVTFLPMERVGADGRIDTQEILTASAVGSGFTTFRRGDILVAKITPCFENGKGADLKPLPTRFGAGSTEFHVLRARSSVLPHFLYRATTAVDFRVRGANAMTGAAGQQRVPSSFIANYPIALPPLREQAEIVSFLERFVANLERRIESASRLIRLVRELSSRLIADAVTGRVDVRTGALQSRRQAGSRANDDRRHGRRVDAGIERGSGPRGPGASGIAGLPTGPGLDL